jgi:tRNA/rRNA methyltransferase
VLAGPEQPANVGFTARAMACYGLDDLRIVGRPGIAAAEAARKTASGGEAVLESAACFNDLAAAVADADVALGFSRRARDPSQRIHDLEEAPSLSAGSIRTALVFGCESQGLSREETLRCSHLVRIPMASETLSLNLSHAVAIALYAMSPGQAAKAPAPASERATLGESERILSESLSLLARKEAFRPAKAEAQTEYLRLLWQRLQPTRAELEFLAGMLKKLGSP